jgi:hypothetical protein
VAYGRHYGEPLRRPWWRQFVQPPTLDPAAQQLTQVLAATQTPLTDAEPLFGPRVYAIIARYGFTTFEEIAAVPDLGCSTSALSGRRGAGAVERPVPNTCRRLPDRRTRSTVRAARSAKATGPRLPLKGSRCQLGRRSGPAGRAERPAWRCAQPGPPMRAQPRTSTRRTQSALLQPSETVSADDRLRCRSEPPAGSPAGFDLRRGTVRGTKWRRTEGARCAR